MATATRPLRVLARALHTSRLVAEEAAAPSAVPRAAGKATAADLGFSGEKRQRKLPSLSVPQSARGNIGGATASAGSDAPRGQPRGDRQQRDGAPRQRREQGDRPPRTQGDRPPRQQGDRPPRQAREQGDRPPRREGGDRPPRRDGGGDRRQHASGDRPAYRPREGRAPEARRPKHASANEIPLEFFEGAELAQTEHRAPRARSDRPPRNDRRSGGNGDRKKPFVKKGSVAPKSAPVTNFHLPIVKRETTTVALFGKSSVLDRVPPGARDPASSFWAKGMTPAQAYQADVLRRAGDYSTRAAPQPKAFGGLKNAAATATWMLSMNPSVSQRRAAEAAEVVARLTK